MNKTGSAAWAKWVWQSWVRLEQLLAAILLFLFVLHLCLSPSIWLCRWQNEVKSGLWNSRKFPQSLSGATCNTSKMVLYRAPIPGEFMVVRPGCVTLIDQHLALLVSADRSAKTSTVKWWMPGTPRSSEGEAADDVWLVCDFVNTLFRVEEERGVTPAEKDVKWRAARLFS